MRRAIFTILLIIIAISSVYIGFRPFGPIVEWRDQNNESEKSMQSILTEKSVQVFKVWATLKLVNGIINVLQSTQINAAIVSVNPLEILAPFDNVFDKLSNLFLAALGAIVFAKILLSISVPAAFFIIIPLCIIVSIIAIWSNKDKRKVNKIVIVCVLISLIVPFAVPVSFMISNVIEEKLFTNNVEEILSSLGEKEKLAENMEGELRNAGRISAAIANYLARAKEISNAIVKDIVNYIIIFMISNILIPIITVFGLYKLIRYAAKLILA